MNNDKQFMKTFEVKLQCFKLNMCKLGGHFFDKGITIAEPYHFEQRRICTTCGKEEIITLFDFQNITDIDGDDGSMEFFSEKDVELKDLSMFDGVLPPKIAQRDFGRFIKNE